MAKKWKQQTEFNLSIIPVNSNKIPKGQWKQFQKQIAPIDNWYAYYKSNGTVGIICGKVSGSLEIIDIDIKNDPTGTITNAYLELIPEELKKRLILQTTPNKGLHLIYRCPEVEIEPNQKLALHDNQEVIIETRGEGGYFCTSLQNNKVIQGQFDLANLDVHIPEVSAKERNILLELARSLTRYFPRETNNGANQPFQYKEPAINQFNKEYNVLELFEKHGWEAINDDGEKVSLLRPGSSTAIHSGYYFHDSQTFYCFSTSTVFKPEKPYNHFQILQVLEGKDDYRTTLSRMSELGFVPQNSSKKEKITADDIAEYLNDQNVRYDTFIQDLTLNGKIIDEIEYNTLFINLKKHFDREIPRTRFEEVIKSNYITQFNPVVKFIDKNKSRNPQGTFEKWFSCVKLRNKEIDRAILLTFIKKWYVGMIAQALGGEYPNEFFLALISPIQGTGKSTFLRKYVLPEELQVYRSEHSLTFDDDFKVLMGQTLLLIDDEMDGRSYESAQIFKNILSQKAMTTRRKYDRRISTINRRCSFAGSGNNLNIVRENSNRRIIPVEVASFVRERLNKIDYTDLFMEAYHMYDSGFEYSYQSSEKESLDSLYKDYIQKSDIDLVLDEYMDLPITEDDTTFVSTLEVVTILAGKFPNFTKRINPIYIGKLMSDRGFLAKRSGPRRISGYLIGNQSKILVSIRGNDGEILLGHR